MKRIKATISDIYNIGGGFFASQRVSDNNGNKGTRYVMEKPLTDKEFESLKQWKNVVISTCQYRYAPEIKHNTIIVLDKCIKA